MHKAKKLLHVILGILLILLGITGLVLPVLNGTLLLLLGFILLSFESPYVEQHLRKLAEKNRLTKEWHEKLTTFMKKHF